MIDFGHFTGENIGPFESIIVDLRDRGLVLVLGDNRDTLAADSNGAGKTSIFHALGWVLFGKTVEGDSGDDIVRIGAGAGWGSVEFDHYLVTRSRAKRDSSLVLRDMNLPEAENDISSATMKDTQAEIVKLLGLDFNTFCNTVMYHQEAKSPFAAPGTTDADRKLVLKKILNLEQLEGAQKSVKAKQTALAEERKPHDRNLFAARAELDGLRETSGGPADDVAVQIIELKKRVAKKAKVEKTLAGVDEVLADCAATHARADKLRNEARDLDVTAAKAIAESAAAKRDVDRLEGEGDRFRKGGKCPTCGTPADGEHVAKHVHALVGDLGEARDKFQIYKDRAANARDGAVDLRKQADELTAETREEEQGYSRSAVMLRGELKAAEMAAADLAQLERAATAARAAAAQRAARRVQLTATIAGAEEAIARIDEDLRHLEFWTRGFGNQGIISFVLDSIVPELTERLNHWLRILTDGDITARVDTQAKLKGGETRDKMSFELTIEGVTGAPPSTGQKKKLVLAGNIALGELLANRENAAIDLMLLDEVLDGLDAAGRSRVADLLLELRKTHSSIFVISHDPAIVQLFEETITVVKEGGVARLES